MNHPRQIDYLRQLSNLLANSDYSLNTILEALAIQRPRLHKLLRDSVLENKQAIAQAELGCRKAVRAPIDICSVIAAFHEAMAEVGAAGRTVTEGQLSRVTRAISLRYPCLAPQGTDTSLLPQLFPIVALHILSLLLSTGAVVATTEQMLGGPRRTTDDLNSYTSRFASFLNRRKPKDINYLANRLLRCLTILP